MPEIDFDRLTLAQVMDRTARRFPEREAIAFRDRRLTWGTLQTLSIKLAKALLNAGIKKGDKVGVMMTNIPEWAIARSAIMRVGAWLVPFNTRYKTHELRMLLERGEVHTLIFMASALGIDFVELVNVVCPGLASHPVGCGRIQIKALPYLRNLVCLSRRDYPGIANFEQFIESGGEISDAHLFAATNALGPDDVCSLLFTAGTTGKPKGVMTTHGQFIRVFSKAAERFDLTADDVVLGAPPFFTNFGLCMGLTISEIVGAKLVAFESFDPADILEGIKRHRITMFCGTPAMYYMLLKHIEFSREKVKSMRVGDIAGAPVTPEMIREVSDQFGMRLFGVYGMTETSGIITFSEKGDSPELVANTVGRNFNAGCETKIVDTGTGNDLPAGQVGEIVTRGWHLTRGYFKDPDLYAASFDSDGWFHTGDLGSMDEMGYVRFAGRLKDLIISGGMNIDPMELENFLMQMPAVESAHVVGLPDERMGEVVAAFIQIKEGSEYTAEDIQSFCAGKIAKYKIPRYVAVIEDIPRTPVGKVQKFKLRERGMIEFNLVNH
ncbi:AMP-binding protein [uncultured Desulfosarcina sp.]|uniref:AMP-binding protein n=1 Tax=uncultured Desulfosarcina sp. TaxID=218289 RepID=UPI0029C65BB8|nr:AMP-binding protein [uncultured Desulfosarcina sp.]